MHPLQTEWKPEFPKMIEKEICFPYTKRGRQTFSKKKEQTIPEDIVEQRFEDLSEKYALIEEFGPMSIIDRSTSADIIGLTGKDFIIYKIDYGCLSSLYSEAALLKIAQYTNRQMSQELRNINDERQKKIDSLEKECANKLLGLKTIKAQLTDLCLTKKLQQDQYQGQVSQLILSEIQVRTGQADRMFEDINDIRSHIGMFYAPCAVLY